MIRRSPPTLLTSSMHNTLATLTALLAGLAAQSRAQQPSPPAACTYACPSSDEGGFALADPTSNNGVLTCSYPAFPGESPTDFYCEYDAVCVYCVPSLL